MSVGSLQKALHLCFFLLPITLIAQSSGSPSIEREYEWAYKGNTYNLEYQFKKADHNYYRSITRHRRYADYTLENTSHSVIAPLTNEFVAYCEEQNFSAWETAEFIVSFVQSLEYQREHTIPEYPKYPIETLVDGGGDCEDTAILLAALLREAGYSTILLSPPGHMATAVAVEGKSGSFFPWNGKKYFYIETTGKNWKIGKVPNSYAGKMTVYEVPGTSYAASLDYDTPPSEQDIQLDFSVSETGNRHTYNDKQAYTYSVSLAGSEQVLEQIKFVGYQRMHGTFQEYRKDAYLTQTSPTDGFKKSGSAGDMFQSRSL